MTLDFQQTAVEAEPGKHSRFVLLPKGVGNLEVDQSPTIFRSRMTLPKRFPSSSALS